MAIPERNSGILVSGGVAAVLASTCCLGTRVLVGIGLRGVAMKKLLTVPALALALASAVAPVRAATKTVALSVPGMTCAACPITVKKALSRVDGVRQVNVGFAKREATVTFDNSKTNARA